MEIHKKYSIAFASLVFVIVGAPLALRFGGGGIGMVIATSMAIFSLYYVGLIGGEALAGRGYVTPLVAMWIVNAIMTVLGADRAGHHGARDRHRPQQHLGPDAAGLPRPLRHLPPPEVARMIRLLSRYVMRTFATTFLLLVLGLPLLFIIADVTDNIDTYMEKGITGASWRWPTPTSSRSSCSTPFPSRRWSATVFTIGGMTRHQELTAAKAGGVSFYRIFLPIAVMSVFLSAAAFGLGELTPITLQKRAVLMGDQTAVRFGPRVNFVYQTEREGVLTARRLDAQSGELSQVVLERNARGTRPGLHRMAERATWTAKGGMEAGARLHPRALRRRPRGDHALRLAARARPGGDARGPDGRAQGARGHGLPRDDRASWAPSSARAATPTR